MRHLIDIVCYDDKYLPTYANDTDFCMDVKVRCGQGGYVLTPGSTHVFGAGIKIKVPEGWGIKIKPRSSTGIKLHCRLANSEAIIDAGYRNEIMLAINNFGNQTQIIEDGQRIAQLELVKKEYIEWNIVPDDENFKKGDRGGGIGSTGFGSGISFKKVM